MSETIMTPQDITITADEVRELQVKFKKLALLTELPGNLDNPLGHMVARQLAGDLTHEILKFIGIRVGVIAENDAEGESVSVQLARAQEKRRNG